MFSELASAMFVSRCRRHVITGFIYSSAYKRNFLNFSWQKKVASSIMARSLTNEVVTDDCLQDYNYIFKPDILKNKVAFITGGGSGIGFRITEILMRHGCRTAIASRKLERVQEAAQKLTQATGVECLPLCMDVRDPQQVQTVVDDILSNYGRIDVLVNNAAGNFLCPAENLSYNAFKTVMEIDTMGTFNVSKAVFEKYFNRNGGNIINITATLAYKGNAMQTHAGSAKAAIDAMTKHLAVEWGSKGVRVNSVAPGPIGGTEGMKRLGGKSELAETYKTSIPLQRWGLKTEIADSCLYLVSDAASFVTGTVLVVDGGSWLTSANDPNMMEKILKSGM
ncbi:peroxisomal 2,4-dienoyl-CoA reductase [(3E)-enoyl-CoA-producing]-like [Clavelina lepadiformis]|uniref:Peroxisomal 2,4-dienoyl-CoA reductase [(3E)-enoyl-CoA-producing] n=1 Tax=Clavelina lepadiformis TaxID=159417 RepID=A0ABP0GX55_CLALP